MKGNSKCNDYVHCKGTSINHVSLSRGFSQMTISLHKLYLVKVATKGRGVKIPKNLTTWFIDDPSYQKYINVLQRYPVIDNKCSTMISVFSWSHPGDILTIVPDTKYLTGIPVRSRHAPSQVLCFPGQWSMTRFSRIVY